MNYKCFSDKACKIRMLTATFHPQNLIQENAPNVMKIVQLYTSFTAIVLGNKSYFLQSWNNVLTVASSILLILMRRFRKGKRRAPKQLKSSFYSTLICLYTLLCSKFSAKVVCYLHFYDYLDMFEVIKIVSTWHLHVH